jgi:hypothetical protein
MGYVGQGMASRVIKRIVVLLLPVVTLGGCATTYVPVSWSMGDKVQQLSRSDQTLAILFNRYDPARVTLRVAGASFDEVMMPSEVKFHLGAYRKDTKLIYRNLYQEFNDGALRDLMLHEFAHHIWFSAMTPKQQGRWGEHLEQNPSPLQSRVRQTYYQPSEYAPEDFAFTVEYARPIDLEELARMDLITPEERDIMLSEVKPPDPTARQQGGPGPSANGPVASKISP